MTCLRCEGLMIPMELRDFFDFPARLCEGWCCMNCGEVVDPVVLQNRKAVGLHIEGLESDRQLCQHTALTTP